MAVTITCQSSWSQYTSTIQCRGGRGACPDTVDTTTGGPCTNDVSDVSGFVQEGQQCISFTRPFNPSKLDKCRCREIKCTYMYMYTNAT